jgi:hypothetical protein
MSTFKNIPERITYLYEYVFNLKKDSLLKTSDDPAEIGLNFLTQVMEDVKLIPTLEEELKKL